MNGIGHPGEISEHDGGVCIFYFGVKEKAIIPQAVFSFPEFLCRKTCRRIKWLDVSFRRSLFYSSNTIVFQITLAVNNVNTI